MGKEKEVLEQEKNNIVLNFGNIVSELEEKNLKLLKIKDNNGLFVVDCAGNLYGIEPYYAGGYLDRFIGEKFIISFERMEQPIRDFEDWRKEFMDASWVKSFIERVVKIEYPNFTQTHKPLTAQIQEAAARATAPCSGESPAKNKNIQFVEKEPWYDNRMFIGHRHRYPVYMVKDNVEYFMFNRSSKQASWDIEKDESRKQQLLNNGGRFFCFHGYKDTPYEYLQMVIARRHTFEKFSHKEVEWSEDGMFCDFQGNLKEVSAAFHYRIYDKDLVANIEKIVGLIHKKKYNEALLALNECNKGQTYERSEEGVSLEDKIKVAKQTIQNDREGIEAEVKHNTEIDR